MAPSTMLAVPDKKPCGAAADLCQPLLQYIIVHYAEKARDLKDDLDALHRLRAAATDASAPLPDRPNVLKSYFRALSAVRSCFPLSPYDGHVIAAPEFAWLDAFKPGHKAAMPDIGLEAAAVVFNLGAAYSQMGLAAHGLIKVRCNSFQLAAGAFAFLWERECPRVAAAGTATVDLSPECAWMLEKLMLAQAQECFFEKAIADGKPPALCAKIAKQVGLYYEEAGAAVSIAPLNKHFDQSWISHVHLKSLLFDAQASYQYSLELHNQEGIGEEIARLKSAISTVANTKKLAKGVASQLQNSVAGLEANLKRNLERAQKENVSVYLMRVPSASSLSPVPAASLVKSSPMVDILDASKEKLFASLVPDKISKDFSRYTKIVDDIIRVEVERMLVASEKSRGRLKEMDLPDSILALEGNCSTLPTDLKEGVEAVQMVGGSTCLDAGIYQLKDLRRVNQELLAQSEELLQKDARDDAQFRSQFDTRWTRPQTSTLTRNLQDRLNRLAGNLKQAADSDERIEREVKEHSVLMSILDRRPIQSVLPSLSRPIMSVESNEVAIVGALKESLSQLEKLGAQRIILQDKLKHMKLKYDILPSMMAANGSQEFIQQEVAKYTEISVEVTKNIAEQEQLLLQIKSQNDHFAAVFNLEDHKAAQEKCYKQITAAIAIFREFKDRIDEGLNFYATLQDSITGAKLECSDFVMTRSIQCREMIEDVQRQIACLRPFQDEKTSSYSVYYSGDQYIYSPSQSQRPPN